MNNIVVFNALQTSLSGGIGRYSYELAKGLYVSNKNYIKIVIREQDKDLFEFADELDLIIVNGIENSKQRNYYEQFKLPKLIANKFPNALIHYPDTMAPLFSKNKVIITVHDLAFKSLTDVFTWKTKLWKNIMTNLSIKKASRVIAITNFTKYEIIKHYPNINENKIQVIYNGFNNFSKEDINLDYVSDKIKDINYDYILTVSTISPRKNIDGLIKSFNIIKDNISEKLVIAGGNGWMFEYVYKLVDELGLSQRVIFTGKITDEELKYLYKGAKVFAYISFYEGFGLPPLEAMSYKVPCLVADKSSLPEVVGDAAVMVNPCDHNEISRGLIDLITNEGLCEKIINNSNNQIEKFSWEKCAYEVKEFYNI